MPSHSGVKQNVSARSWGEYIGTLVNAYLARGGRATAVCAGEAYVDVGTVRGYREAMNLLSLPR